MRNLFFTLIVMAIAANGVAAKNNLDAQIIQIRSKEVSVPAILVNHLKKDAIADSITFSDPKNPFSACELDLNGDGKPELEVTCNGDATNWPIWFFSKSDENEDPNIIYITILYSVLLQELFRWFFYELLR